MQLLSHCDLYSWWVLGPPIVNLRHVCKGYGSGSVSEYVYLLTTLTATYIVYLVYKLKNKILLAYYGVYVLY